MVGTRSLSSGAHSRDPLALPTLQFRPLRIQRRRDAADRRPADQPADFVGRRHQFCHVDPGRNTHALHHVDDVLGRDIAGSAGGVGAAAETAGGGIDHPGALLHTGIEIRQRLAIGVMEVHREMGDRHAAGHRAQQALCLERRTDADGVAERNFVATELPQMIGHLRHRLRLHLAVEGTAEHAGDIAAHPDAVGLGPRNHRLEALDGFGDRAIDIGARKALRRRGKHRNHLRAGGARGLIALFVRHQHMEFAVGMMTDAAQHLVRIHHLRDRLRRHEGPDLDGMQPRTQQRLDEGNAVGDADRRLFVLQPVAGAYFDDAHGIAHADLTKSRFQEATGSTSASSTPSPTISPTLHLIAVSTPANGARRVCSIFITSSVRIGAPFSSLAPTSASKATTVPGSGAMILSSPTCSSSSPPNGSTQCRSKRPLRVRRYSSWPSTTATIWDFMPWSVRSKPPAALGTDVKAISRSPIPRVPAPLPYCGPPLCPPAGPCRNVNTRCRRPTGIQPAFSHGECACARAAFVSSPRMAATPAPSSRSCSGGAAGVRFFSSRSMKPVSIALARTSGWVTSADRNGMLVTMPRTSDSSSPRLSRSIAASRFGAHAITLASMAS